MLGVKKMIHRIFEMKERWDGDILITGEQS